MSLLKLDITGFRNLASVKCNLLPKGFNYFYGKNGSGKTSIIESIYYLIYGRSFRTAQIAHLINDSVDQFTIFSHLHAGDHWPLYPVGVERGRGGRLHIRAGGEESASFAQIARRFPLLLVHSGSHHLLEAGPIFRRKYLDWGAFYQHVDFLEIWKRYARALRQRNTLLRKKVMGSELDIWTSELINSGSELDKARRYFVEALRPGLETSLGVLLPIPDFKMTYCAGWSRELSFAQAVEASAEKDRLLGCTQVGPHRADFKLSINRMPAKDGLSRGQQKLFIYAMIVAQGALIRQHFTNPPVYLLDDLPAELDDDSQAQLLALLQAQNAQVLCTGIQSELRHLSQVKMFHVEHGEVSDTVS